MDVEYANQLLSIRLDKRFSDWTIERFLTEQLQLPQGFTRKLFAESAVRMGQRVMMADDLLQVGSRITLRSASASMVSSSEPPLEPSFVDGHSEWDLSASPVPVLYEDSHVIVVDKPAGLIIHSDDPAEDTLDHRVHQHLRQSGTYARAFHVHRLDKPTTGAVVYAKHPFIARALDAQLVSHQMNRTYVAITIGKRVEKKVVDLPIGRDRHEAGRFRVASSGKSARTFVKVLRRAVRGDKHVSLLRLQLATGRTHQIRVHLSAIGAPILGDLMYGGVPALHDWPREGQIALHAVRVSFWHPYEERVVDVAVPLDWGWRQFLRTEWNVEEFVEERT